MQKGKRTGNREPSFLLNKVAGAKKKKLKANKEVPLQLASRISSPPPVILCTPSLPVPHIAETIALLLNDNFSTTQNYLRRKNDGRIVFASSA